MECGGGICTAQFSGMMPYLKALKIYFLPLCDAKSSVSVCERGNYYTRDYNKADEN